MTDDEFEKALTAHADEAIEAVLRIVLDRMQTPRLAILTLAKANAHLAYACGENEAFLVQAAEGAYAVVGEERRAIEEGTKH